MSRLSLDVPSEFHHSLKVHAAWKGVSIKDFVMQALKKQLERESKPRISKNIPNEETLKTFAETEKGVNLIYHGSKEELFKHFAKLQKEVEQEIAEEKKRKYAN